MKACPVCNNAKPAEDSCAVCEGSGVVCDATAEYYQLRQAIIKPGDNSINDYGMNVFPTKPILPK